jgi:hypothetical protein
MFIDNEIIINEFIPDEVYKFFESLSSSSLIEFYSRSSDGKVVTVHGVGGVISLALVQPVILYV